MRLRDGASPNICVPFTAPRQIEFDLRAVFDKFAFFEVPDTMLSAK
jgi:hypothetical protein